MIANVQLHVYRPLLFILVVLLIACSDGSDADPSQTNPKGGKNSGSLSFTINWKGQSQKPKVIRTTNKEETGNCIGDDFSTIRATLFNSEKKLIVAHERPCADFIGVMKAVPAPHKDVQILLVAKNSQGEVVYRGEKGDITIQANKDNDAGVIDADVFPPPKMTPLDDPIRFQWDAIIGAEQYRVIISGNEDFSNPVSNAICKETTYTPQGLAPNTMYHIKIFSQDAWKSESVASAPVKFTMAGPAATPTEVVATGELFQITLKWKGEAEDRYNIYWSTSSGVSNEKNEGLMDKIEGDAYVHKALKGNTTYYYRVAAVNEDGLESDLSTEVFAKTIGHPDGPNNVTAEAGDRKVTLRWDEQVGFVYNIYWSTEPGVSITNHQGKFENIDADTYVHEGCDSVRHYYIVTAKNDLGESEPLGEVIATPGWIEILGGAGKEYFSGGAVDDSGNKYIAGYLNAPLEDITHQGEEDILLAKYDRNGVRQWIRSYGTAKTDIAHSMGIDASGNIYIVGRTMGIWNEGGTNAGSLIFLLKIDPTGKEQWIQYPFEMKDHSEEMIRPVNVAVDTLGNSYISGEIKRTIDGTESFDVYTAGYDTQGQQQWMKYLFTAQDDASGDLFLDDQGNVYITGSTQGHLEGNQNANPGVYDVFLAKYLAQGGTLQWVKLLGDSGIDFGYMIAVHQNHCFVTGVLSHMVEDKMEPDLFIARFRADDGQHEWTQFIEDARPVTYPEAMAFTPNGNLLMGASTRAERFDGQANAGEPGEDGLYPFDALIITFDVADGSRIWSKLMGSPADDRLDSGIKVDPDGYAYIGGYTQGDFGGYKNSGDLDIFVWKLFIEP